MITYLAVGSCALDFYIWDLLPVEIPSQNFCIRTELSMCTCSNVQYEYLSSRNCFPVIQRSGGLVNSLAS